MSAETLFHTLVVRALEGAKGNSLKVSELSAATKIKRGITSTVEDMKAKGIVSFDGYATMDTQVSLVAG